MRAFVAYSARPDDLAKSIALAVSQANARSTQVRYQPWEFNDIAGVPLVSPILDNIEDSAFVVADITYLNFNVVYEVGFAIGRKKRVHLIRHKSSSGDRVAAQEAGIFDTLGYREYETPDDLVHLLVSYHGLDPLDLTAPLDRLAPVYVVDPPRKGALATTMTSRLKKARYRYRSFSPIEDIRLSALDALRQVSTSSGVLVSLEDPDLDVTGKVHNIRSLFVAGLAHGMGKPTLILCPVGYRAPLDVIDEVRQYRDPDDISEFIHDLSLEITGYLQQADPLPVDTATALELISVGDPTAENEMATLAKYYVPLDQYDRVLRGEINLVVGRKGSGKTALFIQARDRIRIDKRNVVVDLKPEGYQLVKLKEDILVHLTEGARHHLVTAFWEYLLLLEVAYKLLEKDRSTYRHNHEIRDLYLELEATYRVDDFSSTGDFSERLLALSQRISEAYKQDLKSEAKLTAENVSQLVYAHDIAALRARISRYLSRKQKIWILFDNLDKGWSTHGLDHADVVVLRCLIDAGRKLERDMRKAGHEVHCIVFVRNDVYEHLMQNSADYGKEMRAVLDWTDPDLLREMLKRRLVSGFGAEGGGMDFEQIWHTICVSHYQGEETSDYLISRSLMRPRNLLKIFSHIRGFATNFNHQKISEDDVEKGLLAYSHDLLIELDRELVDVFPVARELLYHFIDARGVMSRAELMHLIKAGGVPDADIGKVGDFLLYYGIVGLRQPEADLYIYDVNYDARMLKARAERAGDDGEFAINPAFWPALGIVQE